MIISVDAKKMQNKVMKDIDSLLFDNMETRITSNKNKFKVIANGINTKITKKMKKGLHPSHDACLGIRLKKRLLKLKDVYTKRVKQGEVTKEYYMGMSYTTDFPKHRNVEYGYPLADPNTKFRGKTDDIAEWVWCKIRRGYSGDMFYYKTKKGRQPIKTKEEARRVAYAMLKANYGEKIQHPAKDWYKVNIKEINLNAEVEKLMNLSLHYTMR